MNRLVNNSRICTLSTFISRTCWNYQFSMTSTHWKRHFATVSASSTKEKKVRSRRPTTLEKPYKPFANTASTRVRNVEGAQTGSKLGPDEIEKLEENSDDDDDSVLYDRSNDDMIGHDYGDLDPEFYAELKAKKKPAKTRRELKFEEYVKRNRFQKTKIPKVQLRDGEEYPEDNKLPLVRYPIPRIGIELEALQNHPLVATVLSDYEIPIIQHANEADIIISVTEKKNLIAQYSPKYRKEEGLQNASIICNWRKSFDYISQLPLKEAARLPGVLAINHLLPQNFNMSSFSDQNLRNSVAAEMDNSSRSSSSSDNSNNALLLSGVSVFFPNADTVRGLPVELALLGANVTCAVGSPLISAITNYFRQHMMKDMSVPESFSNFQIFVSDPLESLEKQLAETTKSKPDVVVLDFTSAIFTSNPVAVAHNRFEIGRADNTLIRRLIVAGRTSDYSDLHFLASKMIELARKLAKSHVVIKQSKSPSSKAIDLNDVFDPSIVRRIVKSRFVEYCILNPDQ